MYLRTSSSRESAPSSASRTTAAAVNCFASEPPSKMVAGVLGIPCSRSAMPQARESTVLPASPTERAHPGLSAESHWAKISSTRASASEGGCEHAPATPVRHSTDARKGRGGDALMVKLLRVDARSDRDSALPRALRQSLSRAARTTKLRPATDRAGLARRVARSESARSGECARTRACLVAVAQGYSATHYCCQAVLGPVALGR